MRKASSPVTAPELKAPAIAKTAGKYHGKRKNMKKNEKSSCPTEETLDRLNDIGRSYPFCVYYRQQVNDPL